METVCEVKSHDDSGLTMAVSASGDGSFAVPQRRRQSRQMAALGNTASPPTGSCRWCLARGYSSFVE